MKQSSNASPLGALLTEIRDEAVRLAAYPARAAEPRSSRPPAEEQALPASTVSPLGALLAAMRTQTVQHPSAPRAQKPPPSRRAGLLEPALHLEANVVSAPAGRGARAVWLLPVSALLHAALLVAAIVTPLLTTEPLPAPSTVTRAFFVEPALAPPPPPPPPPPPARPAPAFRPLPRKAAGEERAFTAPVETPESIVPEDPEDIGEGEPGGVPGGIPGGVIGGIVGGLPESPPPLPPVRVGDGIREPRKLKHVSPIYPDIAVRANVRGAVVLECVISPQGRVTAVKVVRGIPLLDDAAIAAVKQWVFTPTLKDGVPVAVILPVTVEFRLQ